MNPIVHMALVYIAVHAADEDTAVRVATTTAATTLAGSVLAAAAVIVVAIINKRVRGQSDVREDAELDLNESKQSATAALALAAETRSSYAQLITDMRTAAETSATTIAGLVSVNQGLTAALNVAQQASSANGALIVSLQHELARVSQEYAREVEAHRAAVAVIAEKEEQLAYLDEQLALAKKGRPVELRSTNAS